MAGGATGTGTVTLLAPVTSTNRTLTFPDQTANIITDSAAILNIGSGQVYKDASGNVGIGTTSPAQKLHVLGSIIVSSQLIGKGTTVYSDGSIGEPSLLTNAISGSNVGAVGIADTTGSIGQYVFRNPNGQVGVINTSGSSTSYVTSSDYRLKDTIAPMIGALDKVALLKPCTYKWKVDGSDGQGFIAHELGEVVPGCVTGEKDEVNADGSPKYQGIDTSFLVATLTAAIKELKAIIDTQATRITALEAK